MVVRGRPSAIDRSRLPEPGPVRSFAFPAIDKSRLSNGLNVWTVSHPEIPLIAFVLLVRRGASADPPGQDGLAAVALVEASYTSSRLGRAVDVDLTGRIQTQGL